MIKHLFQLEDHQKSAYNTLLGSRLWQDKNVPRFKHDDALATNDDEETDSAATAALRRRVIWKERRAKNEFSLEKEDQVWPKKKKLPTVGRKGDPWQPFIDRANEKRVWKIAGNWNEQSLWIGWKDLIGFYDPSPAQNGSNKGIKKTFFSTEKVYVGQKGNKRGSSDDGEGCLLTTGLTITLLCDAQVWWKSKFSKLFCTKISASSWFDNCFQRAERNSVWNGKFHTWKLDHLNCACLSLFIFCLHTTVAYIYDDHAWWDKFLGFRWKGGCPDRNEKKATYRNFVGNTFVIFNTKTGRLCFWLIGFNQITFFNLFLISF